SLKPTNAIRSVARDPFTGPAHRNGEELRLHHPSSRRARRLSAGESRARGRRQSASRAGTLTPTRAMSPPPARAQAATTPPRPRTAAATTRPSPVPTEEEVVPEPLPVPMRRPDEHVPRDAPEIVHHVFEHQPREPHVVRLHRRPARTPLRRHRPIVDRR